MAGSQERESPGELTSKKQGGVHQSRTDFLEPDALLNLNFVLSPEGIQESNRNPK